VSTHCRLKELKPDNPFEKSKVSERVVGLQILETSVKKLLSNATFLNATPPDVVLKQVWAPRPAFTCVGNDLATVPDKSHKDIRTTECDHTPYI